MRVPPPVEPPPSGWDFGGPDRWDPDDDLVGFGADLEPGTLLTAYRSGVFPMPVGGLRRRAWREPMAWWSPVQRAVIELDRLHVSRSLRRSARSFEIRVDTVFDEVLTECADPRRSNGWIDERIRTAYRRLHDLGWAHSVEAWRGDELVGGLYGLAIGGLFAGESMFYRQRDASKVALVGLVELLRDEHSARRLVDVQWLTPHLASLGAVEMPRAEYVARLPALLAVPQPGW